eukprot:2907079-Amphidinium_carterae.2
MQNANAKPRDVESPPPWYEALNNYTPVGGINKISIVNRKSWDKMEAGLRDAGFGGIDMPMEYKLKPGKGHHVVQLIRRGAIVETIDHLGQGTFFAAIDHLLRTGDHIDWDDRGSESGAASMAETPLSEPAYERQLDYIATLRLPDGIENITKLHMKNIATATKGRHMWTRIEGGFGNAENVHAMKEKTHKNAVMKGFPTYTHRWFERPVYRYQQAAIGLGRFFTKGSGVGELSKMSDFNPAWIERSFSADGRKAAMEYLDFWNAKEDQLLHSEVLQQTTQKMIDTRCSSMKADWCLLTCHGSSAQH